jgi:hypothetical protein
MENKLKKIELKHRRKFLIARIQKRNNNSEKKTDSKFQSKTEELLDLLRSINEEIEQINDSLQ